MKLPVFLTLTVITLVATFSAVVTAGDGAVTKQMIKRYESQIGNDKGTTASMNALTNNSINSLSLDRQKLLTHNTFYNHKLESSGIINQQSTGRCWMFAGINVLAPRIMEQLKTGEFELSESYLAFYDKLEKANLYLEKMIALRDRPLNDRTLCIELEYPFGDGGWWHFVEALIGKYGVVPIAAMPETKQSSGTGMINKLIKTKLRAWTAELRGMHAAGKSEKELRGRKEEMLGEIYRILTLTYGPPPASFTFRFESTDSTISGDPAEYTPKSFYEKFLSGEKKDYIALINNPARGYDSVYIIEWSRNVFEESDRVMLNLPVERLKDYTRRALLDSQAVWFACDVGKENYGDSGVFMTGIYDYEATFGLDFSISKADRIRYWDISPNHAMTFMGMDTAVGGEAVKWLVENSWGKKKGKDGFWAMYDSWFDEYVLMTIIDRTLLDSEDAEKLKRKPVQIEPWDPFMAALRPIQ